MGCGKSNDDGNPPVPSKQSDELVLISKESEASDYGQISHVNNTSASAFMPFQFVPVPNSPWENARGMQQSYSQDPRIGNNKPGFTRPGTSQNAHSDHNFIDLRGSLRNRDTFPSGLNHPQVNLNFVPNPSTTPGGYYINAHVGEGKASDVNWSQITKSSLYSGCIPSMAQSTRGTLATNDAKFGASYPGKIDGSFLTLGIGGNAESRTKHKFSSREIASSLEQSGNFHVGQTTTNFSTLSHNLTGRCSGFQPGGLPGSTCSNLGALTSSCNDDGIPHYDAVGPSLNAFQSPHIPEAFKQYEFFESNDRNLGIASKSPGAYLSHGPYSHYQGDRTLPFMPFSNTNTYSSHPGFNQISDPASESAKFLRTISQPTIGQSQNYHARNDRDATFSFGTNSISHTTMPVTQDYLGKLIPPVQGSMTQAIGGGPSSIGVQPIGHISSTLGVNSATALGNTTFPEKIVPQIPETAAMKPSTVGPFPRRLGVQPDYGSQSVNQGMPPRVMGGQSRISGHQSQPVQLTKSLLGSPSGAGYPQESLPPQFNAQTLLFSSGPGPLDAKADKPSLVSNAIGQPSLKRRAVEPPPVASWGRRRKLVHLPTIHNSTVYLRQGTSATLPPPIPSATRHIRWQGFDKLPQPVGTKCLICNRDLSFTPEGPVYQPSIPPAVAVLPCGHAFHDHCLQRITPEDQIKDPPCIPCAIGET